MEIVYVYQRKRKDFGRQALLSERPAELTVDIMPDPAYLANYIEQNPVTTEVQCAAEMSEHEVNTESYVLSNRGVLHTEGGWPKDVDPNDVEHTIRYRKKVEKDEEYIRTVKGLGDVMEHCIKQNNAIDIYEEYFTEDVAEETDIEPPSAKTLNVYRDPNTTKRTATYLSWYPDGGRKIAVAYSMLQFQQMPAGMCLDSYIWDVENPNAPDIAITPSSPLVSLKYNPKDPHTLVGGSYNGQVAYWDVRKGSYPVDSSSIEKSHRDPVYSIAWVQSKTGSEFFSVSTDGSVHWWDIRKLAEPTESLTLDPERNGVVVGGTVIDFEPTMPTKFMVGTEQGTVFSCNRKAKNPNERIVHTYTGHHGRVYALQRNPFFLKNFLTVADWSAKIWNEDIRSPIMSTKYQPSYLTDGCWSPTRPAVFLTSKLDGSLDVWDFVFKQNDPTLTLQVASSALQTVKFQESGKTIAAGARDGSVTIIELSEGLSRMQPSEKATFSQMLEREAKREKTLENAARDRRLKAAQGKQRAGGSAGKRGDEPTVEELIKKAEEDFWKITAEEAEAEQQGGGGGPVGGMVRGADEDESGEGAGGEE